MGRPKKTTLDFFIWERDQSQQPEIAALHRRHGPEGVGIYVLLLEKACQAEFLKFALSDELILEAIADQFRINLEDLICILDTCGKLNLIDAELWVANRQVHAIALEKQLKKRLSERERDRYRKEKVGLDKSFPGGKPSLPAGKVNSPTGKCTDTELEPDTKSELEPDTESARKKELLGSVSGFNSASEVLADVDDYLLDQQQECRKGTQQFGGEKYSAFQNLKQLEKLGVNIQDRALLQAIGNYPDQVPDAIAALEEAVSQNRVNRPTRYLAKAIAHGWKPEEAPQRRPSVPLAVLDESQMPTPGTKEYADFIEQRRQQLTSA